eukprot:6209493-Pleurochrysis_carterae.AAC.1
MSSAAMFQVASFSTAVESYAPKSPRSQSAAVCLKPCLESKHGRCRFLTNEELLPDAVVPFASSAASLLP